MGPDRGAPTFLRKVDPAALISPRRVEGVLNPVTFLAKTPPELVTREDIPSLVAYIPAPNRGPVRVEAKLGPAKSPVLTRP